MCRLLGVISAKPQSAADFLFESEFSLFAQSDHRKDRLQKDGWGIGYYSQSGGAQVVKSSKPVFTEKEMFKAASFGISSEIVIGHIRKASNPRKLPIARLRAPENTQPFTYGNYIFTHNGVLRIPDEAKALLGRYKNKVAGLNDSEVYFWLLMNNLDKAKGSVPLAYEETISGIWGTWNKLSAGTNGVYGGKKSPYFGMNSMFSDGKSLYTFCKHDGEGGNGSLRDAKRPYFKMCYSIMAGGRRVIVASEPMDKKNDWTTIEDNTLLSARVKGEKVAVSKTALPAGA